jgi:hypothetical protein
MESLLGQFPCIGDEAHFDTAAFQIAASEARQGRRKLADEVKRPGDAAESGRLKKRTLPFNRPTEELPNKKADSDRPLGGRKNP